MAPDTPPRLIDGLPPDRRQFLAKLLLGAAYAAPIVASFSLDGLLVEPARAQASNLCANTGSICGKPAIANVAISTTASPATAASGDTITFTVTAINCGPCTATNVNFTQLIPFGIGFLSATQLTGPTFTLDTPTMGFPGRVDGNIGSLGAGVSATFEIKATVF